MNRPKHNFFFPYQYTEYKRAENIHVTRQEKLIHRPCSNFQQRTSCLLKFQNRLLHLFT